MTLPSRLSRSNSLFTVMLMLAIASVTRAAASVYQWSTVVDQVVSPESKGHPRAFLWIPDKCQRVRAVVIAIQNMEEEQIFQDAAFRQTLADLGFAQVWIAPPL